ncbi:unnamed protein product [Rotaria socialis]
MLLQNKTLFNIARYEAIEDIGAISCSDSLQNSNESGIRGVITPIGVLEERYSCPKCYSTDVECNDKTIKCITFTSGYTSRSLKQNHHQYERLKLSRVNLEILSNAMKTTLTLSYDILLVLFLEIRLHCFYHLSLLFRNASHYASVIDADPDENIMTLNRDLTRLQETLHSALNEKKFSFLFQGFGFALATILIRSAPRFIHISETGVTKMCRNIFAIEQTLTQIRTVGDAELMRVNRYCEFLHATRADEILAIIEEHRSEYTEHDYIYLLQLKHLGFPASESVECNLTSLQSNLLPIPLMEQTFQINITDVLPEDMRPKSNRKATLSIKRCALPLVPAYYLKLPKENDDIAAIYVPLSRVKHLADLVILRQFNYQVFFDQTNENTVEIRNDEVQIEVVAAEIPTSPFKVQTTAVPPVTIISAISFTTKMDIIKQFTLNSQQKYAFTIVTSHLDGENQIHAGSTDNQLLMCVPGCGGTDESRKSSKEKQTRTFRPGDTKLENEWRHVKYLIIDEMSMVGLSLLARLNRIVKIAKHINSKIPFGGTTYGFAKTILELPDNKTEHLSAYLLLVPGMPVLLTENVARELGLSNGTCGIYHQLVYEESSADIQFHDKNFPTNIKFITQLKYALVEFPNCKLDSELAELRAKIIPISTNEQIFLFDLNELLAGNAAKAAKILKNNKKPQSSVKRFL